MELLHNQYQALLEISEAIASHREIDQLLSELAPRLHRVVQFDFANLILYEPTNKIMQSHVLETPDPAYACPSGECPMEAIGGWGWGDQRSWGVAGMSSESRPSEREGW